MTFSCVTCDSNFNCADDQRIHYKSEWHRYNLKRNVANLPSVTDHVFAELRKQFGQLGVAEDTQGEGRHAFYCSFCKKPFKSKPQLDNHLHSQRHRLLAGKARTSADSSTAPESSTDNYISHRAAHTVDAATQISADQDSDDEWVCLMDSADEGDEGGEGGGLPVTSCLFCSHTAPHLEASVLHMGARHGFFVPDLEYVCDLRGLLVYLGRKVGEGYMCLWCGERGRIFQSLSSVRKHMRDKAHQKMLFEGEVLSEYADFYDYSALYSLDDCDDSTNNSTSIEGAHFTEDLDEYQLVLPSGVVIGHRSLFRYYRQKPRAISRVVQQAVDTGLLYNKSSYDRCRLLRSYRAMGGVMLSREESLKLARDIRSMQHSKQKYWMQVGVKANRLQKHFRRQCPI